MLGKSCEDGEDARKNLCESVESVAKIQYSKSRIMASLMKMLSGVSRR